MLPSNNETITFKYNHQAFECDHQTFAFECDYKNRHSHLHSNEITHLYSKAMACIR